MALLRPAAYQTPGMPGFAAGPDCHCSPGSHGNTLPLPSSPPSSQTRPGPNNAPSASQWPGHNAPVSVHCQPQEPRWVSWPVWHIYNSGFQRRFFFLFKNSVWAGMGGGWMALAFPVNILIYSTTSFFPGALPSPLSSCSCPSPANLGPNTGVSYEKKEKWVAPWWPASADAEDHGGKLRADDMARAGACTCVSKEWKPEFCRERARLPPRISLPAPPGMRCRR